MDISRRKGRLPVPSRRNSRRAFRFQELQRDGVLYNVKTKDDVNDLNNVGFRTQLLYTPTDKMVILLSGDYTRQRPEGYAQVVTGVAPTLRPVNRQWNGIASDLGYHAAQLQRLRSRYRHRHPLAVESGYGRSFGGSRLDAGQRATYLITAWRYWLWRPSNDRDFVGLPITTISAAPSRQRQWTQEVRYASVINSRINYLVGSFFFWQTLNPASYHKQEQGSAAARYLLAPTPAAATPGLLDGYGQNISFDFRNFSGLPLANWNTH
jgi:iron complex outermembrane receptor protein